MKYYNIPLVIEKETERAIKVENGGWLPKSQIIIHPKDNLMASQRIEIPAWLAVKNGLAPYNYEIKHTNIYIAEH